MQVARTLVLAMMVLLSACAEERRYLGEAGLHQVALTKSTRPAFATKGDALFVVEQRVGLPVLRPPESVLHDLRQAASAFDDLPFRRLPWVQRGDLAIEVDFTLSNLDDAMREVVVIVNGFNEFHEYRPGLTVTDDAITPDFSQWERAYRLEPEQRISRTIREEEFDEIAVDLAIVVNGAPDSNAVVFFENESSDDQRSSALIPDVVPGLAGFHIGLRATAAADLVLDVSVRVRDAGERLADEGDEVFEPRPEPFAPIAAER